MEEKTKGRKESEQGVKEENQVGPRKDEGIEIRREDKKGAIRRKDWGKEEEEERVQGRRKEGGDVRKEFFFLFSLLWVAIKL